MKYPLFYDSGYTAEEIEELELRQERRLEDFFLPHIEENYRDSGVFHLRELSSELGHFKDWEIGDALAHHYLNGTAELEERYGYVEPLGQEGDYWLYHEPASV